MQDHGPAATSAPGPWPLMPASLTLPPSPPPPSRRSSHSLAVGSLRPRARLSLKPPDSRQVLPDDRQLVVHQPARGCGPDRLSFPLAVVLNPLQVLGHDRGVGTVEVSLRRPLQPLD